MALSPSHDSQNTDKISGLPDDILYHILSFLPTKQAVGTAILSRRWANLLVGVCLPHLQIDDCLLSGEQKCAPSRYESIFIRFVDRLLRTVNLNVVRSLSFSCFGSYGSARVSSWLSAACTPNLVEINIYVSFNQDTNRRICGIPEPIHLPRSVSVGQFLRVLKLNAYMKLDIPPGTVCFPSLKVLHVFVHNQRDDYLTRRLYKICPVLEELVIEGRTQHQCRNVVFDIFCPTLRRLKIEFLLAHLFSYNDYRFLIHTENLEYLHLSDDFLAEYVIFANMPVLDKASISVGYIAMEYDDLRERGAIRLLRGLSNVKSLSLSGCTTRALASCYDSRLTIDDDEYGDNDDWEDDDWVDDISTFHFLTHLELGFLNLGSWTFLISLLNHSPKLEFLVLKKEMPSKKYFITNLEWKAPEAVPECLLYQLKAIDIVAFEGWDWELIVIRFLLSNASVLQKMAIYCQLPSLQAKEAFYRTVSAYPRASGACQVQFF